MAAEWHRNGEAAFKPAGRRRFSQAPSPEAWLIPCERYSLDNRYADG